MKVQKVLEDKGLLPHGSPVWDYNMYGPFVMNDDLEVHVYVRLGDTAREASLQSNNRHFVITAADWRAEAVK